jgi:Bcr/CflA subfamily drug resistance transporter
MSDRLFIFLVMSMVPITGIGVDMYVPSLPAISQALAVSPTLAQLTVPAYVFGFAGSQILYGILSDSWGRKPLLFAGTLLFIISSLLITVTDHIAWFLVLRFLQSFGIAVASVIAKAMLSDRLSREKVRALSSWYSCSWSIGPVIAPFIGGYLQNAFGWKAAFYVFALYGLWVLALCFLLPETLKHKHPLQLRRVLGNQLQILRHSTFVLSALSYAWLYSTLVVFSVIGPFLIQSHLGYSPVAFGYCALFMGLAWFLGNLHNPYYRRRFSSQQLLLGGVILLLIVCVLMVSLAIFMPLGLWQILLPSFLILYGSAVLFPVYFGECMTLFPEIGGSASALMGTLAVLGTMTSSSIASIFHTDSMLNLALMNLALLLLTLLFYFLTHGRKRAA